MSSIADCSDGSDCPTIGPDGECCRCIGQALIDSGNDDGGGDDNDDDDDDDDDADDDDDVQWLCNSVLNLES